MHRFRLAAVILAAALLAPAAATAANLTPTPPVPLPSAPGPPAPKPPPKRSTPAKPAPSQQGPGTATHRLPKTGMNLPLEVLVAAALLVAGVALRIRQRARRARGLYVRPVPGSSYRV